MMKSQELIRESKASLAIITLSVLFITGTSLLSMSVLGEWFGWLPIPVYFILPAIIFILLSYMVVRYGYKKHAKADGKKLRTILMLAGIILTCLPTAYVVNQYIWRAGVIDGIYPLSKYNATDIELGKVSTLHIFCSSISFLVFLCIAGIVWLYRTKLASQKGLLIVNLVLQALSLWTIQIVDSHNQEWYYGNEKVLNDNIEKYYAQINQLDSISKKYSTTVTHLYDQLLIDELRDYSRGDEEPLPIDAPLKDRHKRYDEMQDWLFDCINASSHCSTVVKNIWDECKEREGKLRAQIHALIDIQKIQNIQESMDRIEWTFSHMDYDLMENGQMHREQVEKLTSIAFDLEKIGTAFTKYMEKKGFPVNSDIELITYEATEKLQSVDNRLNSYNSEYQHE